MKTPKTPRLSSISQIAQTDETVSRAKDQALRLMKRIPVDELLDELSNMQSSRYVRGLSANDVVADQGKRLNEASLQSIAYRARAVEIKMRVVRVIMQVKDGIDAAQNYVKYTHREAVAAAARTQADRNALVRSLFETQIRKIGRLESIITVADLVIDDLDQCSWGLRRITDVVIKMNDVKH